MHYPLSLSLPLESSSRRLKENSVDCRPCARLNFTPSEYRGHRSFCIMSFLPSLRSSYTWSDSRPRITITHPPWMHNSISTYDLRSFAASVANSQESVESSIIYLESSIPPLRLRLVRARTTPTRILLTIRIPMKFCIDPNYRGNVGYVALIVASTIYDFVENPNKIASRPVVKPSMLASKPSTIGYRIISYTSDV